LPPNLFSYTDFGIIDEFRSTNWDLEVTLYDLKSTLSDSQSSDQQLESEAKRLIKRLSSARDSADSFKTESEKLLQTTIEELKAKHEIEHKRGNMLLAW